MRMAMIIGVIVLFLAGLIGGAVLGIWFASKYEIVPRGTSSAQPLTRAPVPPPLLPSLLSSRSASEGSPSGGSPAPASPPAQSASASGPFQFRFTPGQVLPYRLNVGVAGEGNDGTGLTDIVMDMNGGLSLTTESVDSAGSGQLKLAFDSMRFDGDFMGSPFSVAQDASGTFLQDGGRTQIDTAQGIGSILGIPQLEFFRDPISMRVGADGRVQDLAGGGGIATLLTAAPSLSTLDFPSGDLQIGQQWESQFQLPVPGLGTPAQARIVNTLLGYQYVDDRYCAVIQQDFLSEQSGGTLNAPSSVLGEGMGFKMPLFKVEGQNMVYFDVNAGQLAHTDMDLRLALELDTALGSAAHMLGMLGALAEGDTSGLDRYAGQGTDQQKPFELAVDIQGSLAIDEQARR